MSQVHAMLTHPTNPELRGPVTFRVPDLHTAIAIQRRITELANAGRNSKLPVLHPMDLPPAGYQLCTMIATLEHVIVTAPKGMYRQVGNQAVLAPGALVEFEHEEVDGVIALLYTAYQEWRSRFRGRRAGTAAGSSEGGSGAAGGAGGEGSGTGPADGAGHPGGPADAAGRGAAAAPADEPQEARRAD